MSGSKDWVKEQSRSIYRDYLADTMEMGRKNTDYIQIKDMQHLFDYVSTRMYNRTLRVLKKEHHPCDPGGNPPRKRETDDEYLTDEEDAALHKGRKHTGDPGFF